MVLGVGADGRRGNKLLCGVHRHHCVVELDNIGY